MDENEVMRFLRDTSFTYLSVDGDCWYDGEYKQFDDMPKKYLVNCLNMLKREKKAIEHGVFLLDKKYDENCKDQIIHITTTLYKKKVKALEDYLK